MSDAKSRGRGVRFEPVGDTAKAPADQGPSHALLLFGGLFPAAVVVFELVTRMCADALFDPMPTWAHVAAVAFVPAVNILAWRHVVAAARSADTSLPSWLAFANAAAISVAGFYTLLLLPVLPIAAIAIVVGVGVLPFAPLAALIAATRLRRHMRAVHAAGGASRRLLAGGIVTGLALLLALDVPQAATRLGIAWAADSNASTRARGLALLRALGDDDLLLRLCYDTSGVPTGLLSAAVLAWQRHPFDGMRAQRIAQGPAEVREIYYRVRGEPFNARPAPRLRGRPAGLGDFAPDNDHGGSVVGGRVRGLDLLTSRLDGHISGDDAVAYLEWVFEFRNTSLLAREARLQVALPPGGVVSRATLWVNGEEREAAYAGKGQVRAAYERVAVRLRMDPLLVTTKGADRVLAQAFPVSAGGTIKFKLGITAPLDLVAADKGRLVLPAIVDRNFSIGADAAHQVWIESRRPLSASVQGLAAKEANEAVHRLSGALSDRLLAGMRPTITVERDASARVRFARAADGSRIRQDIVATMAEPGPLMLVVDGSARLGGRSADLVKALDAIPTGTPVGIVVAGEPVRRAALAPWSAEHRRAVAGLIGATHFVGGQDNTAALVEALAALEGAPNATLLWVHGPQPVRFGQSAARLEQVMARMTRLPGLVLYNIDPGPNEALPDGPWAWAGRSLPQTGKVADDLAGLFARNLGGASGLDIRRSLESVDGADAGASEHIARLWAASRVLEIMRRPSAASREEAVALAAAHRLVTPVSGAVVLETAQQFKDSGLTPVSQATVPTVPEPHEWALMLVAGAMLLWLVRQRQLAGRGHA